MTIINAIPIAMRMIEPSSEDKYFPLDTNLSNVNSGINGIRKIIPTTTKIAPTSKKIPNINVSIFNSIEIILTQIYNRFNKFFSNRIEIVLLIYKGYHKSLTNLYSDEVILHGR